MSKIDLNEWQDISAAQNTNAIRFYKNLLKSCNNPMLELMSGTGVYLNVNIKEGMNVDAIDSSTVMNEIALNKLKKAGLSANIYNDDIRSFEIERKYNTIYCTGHSIQIIWELSDLYSALKSILEHLLPGGVFVFDIINPEFFYSFNKKYLLKSKLVKDSKIYLLTYEYSIFDCFEGIVKKELKYELYKDNILHQTLNENQILRVFNRNEIELILKNSKFTNIEFEFVDIYKQEYQSILIKAYKPWN